MPGSQKPAAAFNLSDVPVFGALRCTPAPVHDRFLLYIEVNQRAQVTMSLHDLAGRRIWQRALENVVPGEVIQPLETSGIPSGTYLLQLAAGQSKASQRIVIVR